MQGSEEGDADFIVTLNPEDFPKNRLKARVTSPIALLWRPCDLGYSARRASEGSTFAARREGM